jgi:hypothetical protein
MDIDPYGSSSTCALCRHESVMPVFGSRNRDGLILLREAEMSVHQAVRSEVPAFVIGTGPATERGMLIQAQAQPRGLRMVVADLR